MRSNTPGAIAISALLHAAVFGLVLFFSYAASNVAKDNPKVFELVAGAGDNYAATAAPALGSPGGIKVPPVPVARPVAQPAPPKQAPSPIQAAPEAAPAKPAKPVDLVSQLKRVEARRERRLEAQYKKEEEAQRKREAQEELQRQQAAAREGKVQHIDAEGIAAGVIGGSTENKKGGAGGKALTREEGSELDAYFALLKARIKENHVPPEGVSSHLEARVECLVAADGSMSHVHIVHSSGNYDFDLSVIEACEHTPSIGPRPDGRSDTVEMTFKMSEEQGP